MHNIKKHRTNKNKWAANDTTRVKDTGVLKVQAQGGKSNGTPGKRKEISPLQPEDQMKGKIKRRMKPNYLEPIPRLKDGDSLARASSGNKRSWMANVGDEEDKKEERQRKKRSEEEGAN